MSHLAGLDKLNLINFQSSAITKSIKVQEEMTRLRDLPTLPLPHFQILPAADHLTIIHLNVRSYTAKLSDLQNDQ